MLLVTIPPAGDVFPFQAYAQCQCDLGVGRTAHVHAHNRCIVLRSSNATVSTCLYWWLADAGCFLQMIKPHVIDILTPEIFVHCQCYLVIGRTTHDHDHNRCILLRSSGSMIHLFFSTFPFTCLGSTFETCLLYVFRPFCLFHLGSFIPLSVGLFSR